MKYSTNCLTSSQPFSTIFPLENDSLFENLDRICSDKYVPTVVDVIRTRTKTIGITDMKFDVGDGKQLRLVDVGGQRNERRKWYVTHSLNLL